MTLVAFAVLFAGVVSSVLAGATTSLLLAFILPVSLPGPGELDPRSPRRLGTGVGRGAARHLRCCGRRRSATRVRTAAIAPAAARCAARLRVEPDANRAGRASIALHDVFFATPYRPTGLSTSARAVVRLVDELKWLDEIVTGARSARASTRAHAVRSAAATVLERGADLLDAPSAIAGRAARRR